MAGTKAKKQTMFDEFEIKGYWWIPGGKKYDTAGILFYKERGIHLELIGSFSSDAFSLLDEKYDVIHGFSDKGEEFTLLNVTVKNSQSSIPGFKTQTFSIQSFLVGGYFNSEEEMHFYGLKVNTSYFTQWLSRPIFKYKSTYEQETSILAEQEVKYSGVDTFKHYVDSISATIEETHYLNFIPDLSERILWTNKSGIKIIPDENQNLQWYRTNMYLLKNLFHLFIGHPLYFDSLVFYGEKEKLRNSDDYVRKQYFYFFGQDKSKLKKKFNWSDVIVNFNDVEHHLSNILNHWFEKHDKLEVVYDLHFDEFYKDIYINTTFLNTIQVLEIYHRNMYDGKVYDKKEYRALIKELKQHLKENFPEDFTKIISDKVNYGNEYSLAQRIKELINNFEESTRTMLVGTEEDVDKFVRQMVETRNYLTHYDSDKKKHLLTEPYDKYFAIQRLRAIATLILFKEVGLDESFMVDKICKSKQYSYGLKEAKKLLN
ncbi:hypothetical protein JYA63_17400 [Fictibacillus nanhaiensis]|uniref:ApeA N-terminal domain-containing protein n=1 Tax=Fictibacillus nanhaiensis TaxID=742169 RepID=A0ABS2ZT53_9BACL|nr:hypothetical protein [Fictibacillus nanhaiensis]